jgi:hypothetical protein
VRFAWLPSLPRLGAQTEQRREEPRLPITTRKGKVQQDSSRITLSDGDSAPARAARRLLVDDCLFRRVHDVAHLRYDGPRVCLCHEP